MENYCDFIGKSADCLVARIEKMLKEAPDEPIRCLDNVQKCALDIIGLGRSIVTYEPIETRYKAFIAFSLGVSPTSTAVGSRERQHKPYDRQRVLRHMIATQEHVRNSANTHHVTNTRKAELQKLSNHTADSQALEKNQDGSGSLFMDSLLLAHMKAPSSYTLDDVGKDADFMMLAETLRLCPPFPYYGKVLDQDLTLDGCTLPKGVSCFINLFSLHRNPNEFERPEEYVPERFLSDEDTYHHPFSYVPFSAGPKNCLGQKFVMMEIKIVLVKILSKFTVESTRPLQELEMTFDISLKAKGGLPVLFRKRNQT
ncbi:hypothetical protein HPB49_007240 [Dermacentor silvarum]|uniref:Uncharacterized protein n=1 Tax=Dermacentor silvarum TaxID=543639 RepID=A0ACB8DX96_DERSI|nr:hypothetical protein HPB49_007240 [Dermacentor silvarum]